MIKKSDIGKKCTVQLFNNNGRGMGFISSVKNGIASITNLTIDNNHSAENGTFTMLLDIKRDSKRVLIHEDQNYSSVHFFYSN
jgi:hypothetical protein